MRKFATQQGMTLIELMVSMVIGLFLVMGAVTVYTQGRQNFQANEAIARLQENIRFSLNVLEPDIRLAGYWGLNNRGTSVDTTGVAVTCVGGGDVSAWALDTGIGIDAVDNVQAADAVEVTDDCPAFGGGIVVNTDLLFVRHASGTPGVAFDDERIQVQSALKEAHLFDDGALHPSHAAFDANQTATHNLVVNAWYVSEDSNAMDGVPSLRRLTLIDDEMVDEEVIAGVENMQVQFGIDTDLSGGDGSVDRYVDAEDPALAGNNILSVRLWFLIRSPDAESGFAAGKAGGWDGYVPLDAGLENIVPDDKFRRMQASKTIFLRNFQRDQVGT